MAFPKVIVKYLTDIPEPHTLIYGCAKTEFGDILIATINNVVCCLQFISQQAKVKNVNENDFKLLYPKAKILEDNNYAQKHSNNIFDQNGKENSVEVLLNGTEFQNSVWKALNEVPFGEQWTYSDLAEAMGAPKSVRAVANAVGKNEVAVLVPCHRIISKDGNKLKYRWGGDKKSLLLDYESKH